MNRGLRWYLTGTALFLIPGGVQIVLYPWLVAVYLNESPTRVIATNIYQNTPNGWRMLAHHASLPLVQGSKRAPRSLH